MKQTLADMENGLWMSPNNFTMIDM
jgi:hypothetical protein